MRPAPATAVSLVGLARMGRTARRFLSPDPAAPPIDVRVVIPARDEAPVITGCVRSVVAQATEVVVVDDASADGTNELAAAAGARVVRLEDDVPAGWLGKPRACLTGADGATTEWLAFVDADVVLTPAALTTMAAATRSTSTSIVGGLDCRSFWERLLLPELGLALTQEGFPPGFASGQCFLVRRDHYEAVGGHGHPNVRGSVVDDRELALVLGGHDPRLAPKLMTARMYTGWSEIRAGLTKNAAALHRRPVRHLLWLLLPVLSRRPWAAVLISAAGRMVSGQRPAYGLLCPLARAVLAAFHVESVFRAGTGRTVAWKGRDVALQSAGQHADSVGRTDTIGERKRP